MNITIDNGQLYNSKWTYPAINFTSGRKDLAELKKLYAKSKPGDTFKFKGQDVLHEYAKYLIEYAESQLK